MKAAETLAHELENYLRALRRQDTQLSAAGVDGLIAGTNALEQVIAARRAGQSLPDIQALLTQLAALVPPGENAARATMQTPPGNVDGRTLWRCTFQPTAELAARGINVNRIRAHMQSLGELLRATPQVTAQGIAFEFLLASNAEADAFAGSANDGLVCRREEAPAVDDEPDTLALLAAILIPTGAELRQATGTAQAIALWRDQRPDVLVSDIGLPDVDGYELIHRLRAAERETQQPL